MTNSEWLKNTRARMPEPVTGVAVPRLPGWHGPLVRPAGLPARQSRAGPSGNKGNPLENHTRSVRRVTGQYGPVARAPRFALARP